MKIKYCWLVTIVLLLSLIPIQNTAIVNAQSSCSEGGSGEALNLRALNLTDQTLNVYWNNFSCVETFIQTIVPGEAFLQDTFDGHEWIFRNEAGVITDQFIASASQPIVALGDTVYNAEPVDSACSSNATSEEIVLTVINNTTERLLLNWINFECAEDTYQYIMGNSQLTQGTFVGHDWVVRFTDGRVAAQISMTVANNTVTINPPPAQATIPPPPPPAQATLPPPPPPAQATLPPATTADSASPTQSGCEVRAVTPDLRLESFYTKYCDYNGILIAGSSNVSDVALQQAWLITAGMLSTRPDIVDRMAYGRTMIPVISEEETANQVPEMRWRTEPYEFRVFIKAGEAPRLVVVGEDLLLCTRESSSVRESLAYGLAVQIRNTINDGGFDPTLMSQVEALYNTAVANGTFDSNESASFFFNQGVLSYFDVVGTRAELQQTYPELYSLIDRIFAGAAPLSVGCPGTATGAAAPASGSGVTCVVQAQGANTRSAPTANANSMGSLSGSTTAVAQTNGADGFVWYKLSNNSWIRSDVTFADANCANLPTE